MNGTWKAPVDWRKPTRRERIRRWWRFFMGDKADQINYRELLKKYLWVVGEAEGIYFIDGYESGAEVAESYPWMTPTEGEALLEVVDEAGKQYTEEIFLIRERGASLVTPDVDTVIERGRPMRCGLIDPRTGQIREVVGATPIDEEDFCNMCGDNLYHYSTLDCRPPGEEKPQCVNAGERTPHLWEVAVTEAEAAEWKRRHHAK